MLLRTGPSAADAISIASSHSVPPTNSPRSSGPAGRRGAPRRRPARSARRGPSRRSTASAAAVRSGWPRPSSASSTGVPSAAAYSRISAATSSAGGLETTTISSTAGSASRRRSASRVASPRDLGGQVAAADAERRGDADAGVVEQREQLLAAGAGGGDDADRAGLDGVGEAEAEAADDGGAAVGAHHQQAALGGGPLERDLLVERHVVAEDHHVAAGVEGVHRLDERAGAGHRDQREARRAPGAGRSRWCAAAPPRSGPSSRRSASRSARVDRRPGRASSGAVVVEPQRDDHVVGRRRRRDRRSPSRSSTSTLSGVAIATWAASTPVDALHGAAHLQQRHRVGVRAGPQLDVACVMRRLMRRLRSCGRARSEREPGAVQQPGAGGVADRGEGRGARRARRGCRARRGTPRTRAAPRRAARSRAASPTAAWCGRRRARTAASTAAVATPAARCTASQPHSTSSPSGVSPSPRPTSRATASGRGRPAARRATSSTTAAGGMTTSRPSRRCGAREVERGTRTSTTRPTGSGVPSRCRTPPRTYGGSRWPAGPRSGAAIRSAHGTAAAPRRDHAEAAAVEVDVHRVPAAVHDRSGPSGAAAQPVPDPERGADRDAGGGVTVPDASRRSVTVCRCEVVPTITRGGAQVLITGDRGTPAPRWRGSTRCTPA